MLPPYLKAVQAQLRENRNRSRDENNLLEEIDWLDTVGGMDEVVQDAQRRGLIRESASIRAKGILIDQGNCPCCGR